MENTSPSLGQMDGVFFRPLCWIPLQKQSTNQQRLMLLGLLSMTQSNIQELGLVCVEQFTNLHHISQYFSINHCFSFLELFLFYCPNLPPFFFNEKEWLLHPPSACAYHAFNDNVSCWKIIWLNRWLWFGHQSARVKNQNKLCQINCHCLMNYGAHCISFIRAGYACGE